VAQTIAQNADASLLAQLGVVNTDQFIAEFAKAEKAVNNTANAMESRLQKSANTTQRTIDRASESIKHAEKSTINLGYAATNASRFVSDLNYGFMAVQNNIGPLALSLGAGGALVLGLELVNATMLYLVNNGFFEFESATERAKKSIDELVTVNAGVGKLTFQFESLDSDIKNIDLLISKNKELVQSTLVEQNVLAKQKLASDRGYANSKALTEEDKSRLKVIVDQNKKASEQNIRFEAIKANLIEQQKTLGIQRDDYEAIKLAGGQIEKTAKITADIQDDHLKDFNASLPLYDLRNVQAAKFLLLMNQYVEIQKGDLESAKAISDQYDRRTKSIQDMAKLELSKQNLTNLPEVAKPTQEEIFNDPSVRLIETQSMLQDSLETTGITAQNTANAMSSAFSSVSASIANSLLGIDVSFQSVFRSIAASFLTLVIEEIMKKAFATGFVELIGATFGLPGLLLAAGGAILLSNLASDDSGSNQQQKRNSNSGKNKNSSRTYGFEPVEPITITNGASTGNIVRISESPSFQKQNSAQSVLVIESPDPNLIRTYYRNQAGAIANGQESYKREAVSGQNKPYNIKKGA